MNTDIKEYHFAFHYNLRLWILELRQEHTRFLPQVQLYRKLTAWFYHWRPRCLDIVWDFVEKPKKGWRLFHLIIGFLFCWLSEKILFRKYPLFAQASQILAKYCHWSSKQSCWVLKRVSRESRLRNFLGIYHQIVGWTH